MWSYPPAAILVPVDFGEASLGALGVAGRLARRYGARLDVLHAESLEAPPYFTRAQVGTLERHRREARRRARDELATLAAQAAVYSVSVRIVEGPPAEAILTRADEDEIDLIVMGTHGPRGASRWWLGSVAERVARESPLPVLVVPPAPALADEEAILRHPVLVGVSSRPDVAARRYAAGLAAAFGGAVAAELSETACETASRRGRTLAVVAKRPDGWIGEPVERFLQSGEGPILFVPNRDEKFRVT